MMLSGDSQEILGKMEPGTVDAFVTDPPYGLNDGRSERMVGIYKGENSERPGEGKWKAFAEDWDTELPLWWVPEAKRLLVPGGAVVAFTDLREVGTLWRAYQAAGITPLRIGVWVKTNPPTNPRKNFRSGLEGWVFGRKKGKVNHWGGRGTALNYWHGPRPQGRKKIHSTQKPVELMEWFVRLVVPPGGTVVDPFAGSASTGVATLRAGEGRRFIGIEQDQDMATKGQARLDEERMSPGRRLVEAMQREIPGQLTLWTGEELDAVG